MAFSLVAHANVRGNPTNATTASRDTTGADLLVLCAAYYNGSPAPVISDSKSNTWTGLTQYSGGAHYIRILYCQGGTVGSGHTFSAVGADSYPSLAVLAFSGSAASPFDVQSGSPNTLTPGSLTPTQDNEVLVTMVTDDTSGSVATAIDLGFTIPDTPIQCLSGNGFGIGAAYLIETTAAAKNPSWSTGSGSPGSAMATFKAAGGSPPPPPPAVGAPYYYRHLAGGASL